MTEYKRLLKVLSEIRLLAYHEDAAENNHAEYINAIDDVVSIIEKRMTELRER